MWFALAMSAAMLWGVSYAIAGRILRDISTPTLLLISSAVSTIVMLVYAAVSKNLLPDLRVLSSSRSLLGLVAVSVIVYVLANVAITHSIAGKNATLAAVVEIAYPIFTALAAWLLFGQKQLGPATLVGGLLIFAGAAIIGIYAK